MADRFRLGRLDIGTSSGPKNSACPPVFLVSGDDGSSRKTRCATSGRQPSGNPTRNRFENVAVAAKKLGDFKHRGGVLPEVRQKLRAAFVLHEPEHPLLRNPTIRKGRRHHDPSHRRWLQRHPLLQDAVLLSHRITGHSGCVGRL